MPSHHGQVTAQSATGDARARLTLVDVHSREGGVPPPDAVTPPRDAIPVTSGVDADSAATPPDPAALSDAPPPSSRPVAPGGNGRLPWQGPFLAALAVRGNVSEAARAVGLSRQAVYQQRHRRPAFAAAWDEAVVTALDSAEAELYRRGVEGWTRPVYYAGKVVGDERAYSDQCLIRFLAAKRPEEYGRHVGLGPSSQTGQRVVVKTAADALAELRAYRAASQMLLASILSEPAGPDAPPLWPGVSPDTAWDAESDTKTVSGSAAATPPDPPNSDPTPTSQSTEIPPGRPCPRCAGPRANPYCLVCHGRGRLGG
jgi:hypothetical protein